MYRNVKKKQLRYRLIRSMNNEITGLLCQIGHSVCDDLIRCRRPGHLHYRLDRKITLGWKFMVV